MWHQRVRDQQIQFDLKFIWHLNWCTEFVRLIHLKLVCKTSDRVIFLIFNSFYNLKSELSSHLARHGSSHSLRCGVKQSEAVLLKVSSRFLWYANTKMYKPSSVWRERKGWCSTRVLESNENDIRNNGLDWNVCLSHASLIIYPIFPNTKRKYATVN